MRMYWKDHLAWPARAIQYIDAMKQEWNVAPADFQQAAEFLPQVKNSLDLP